MAAFLARKLPRKKNRRLERHGWEKEVKICGKEDSRAKVLKSLKVQIHQSFLSRTWRNILNQGDISTGAMVLSS